MYIYIYIYIRTQTYNTYTVGSLRFIFYCRRRRAFIPQTVVPSTRRDTDREKRDRLDTICQLKRTPLIKFSGFSLEINVSCAPSKRRQARAGICRRNKSLRGIRTARRYRVGVPGIL